METGPGWGAADWKELHRLAGFHRVRPLLFSGLLSLSNDIVVIPQEDRERLRTRIRAFVTTTFRHVKEVVDLVQDLRAEGVEIVPYKGVMLAEQAYRNWGQREFSDIDFLFDPKDYKVIERVLVGRGYQANLRVPDSFLRKHLRRGCEYHFDLQRDGKRLFHVEPHWQVGLRRQQINITYQQILPLTHQAPFLKTQMNRLSPEGLLLLNSMHHGGKDHWRFLRHICDMAVVMDRFANEIDWDKLLLLARQFKVRNLLLCGVGMAVALFPVSVPDRVTHFLQAQPVAGAVEDRLGRLNQVPDTPLTYKQKFYSSLHFHFRLRQYWTTKIRVLVYHLTSLVEVHAVDLQEMEQGEMGYRWFAVRRSWDMFWRNLLH